MSSLFSGGPVGPRERARRRWCRRAEGPPTRPRSRRRRRWRRWRLGDHDGDLIRFPAADRSVDGGCTRVVDPHERRLVAHREAVLVHGRVAAVMMSTTPGTARHIGRHRQHPGVSPAREDDNGVQCSGRNGIACVFDRPVGLGGGVVAERDWPTLIRTRSRRVRPARHWPGGPPA